MTRFVLVTGASAGIGAAFARAYARRGFNLALTARRGDRLARLAQTLRAEHGVDADVIVADLADPAAPQAILAAAGRPIDVLINNAGYGVGGGFAGPAWETQAASLQVMLAAPTELAHRALPSMRARGYGRIINVASMMGLLPPGQGLYGPIKTYLTRFSEALHAELKGSGVNVTALCPGLTRSEFHAAAQMTDEVAAIPAALWQGADRVVEAAIAANEANRPVLVTGWPNRAIVALARIAPGAVAAALSRRRHSTTSANANSPPRRMH